MSGGSEKRIRSAHLTIRLAPEERAAIDNAAERAGLMAGSYARQTLLGAPAPRQVRRPPVERKELIKLLGEFGKVGSNLNQIAHSMNTGVLVYEAEIERALADLHAMRVAVLSALGREP